MPDDLPSHKWLGYFHGDVCGTAVHTAKKLKRQWISIKITHLAISLIEKRLKDALKTGLAFDILAPPETSTPRVRSAALARFSMGRKW